MEQSNDTETVETVQEPARATELVRPVEGRMIAGVGAGIANRYGYTTWVTRAVFIVLAFVGGLGLALYLAGWVLIRSEDESQAPAERFFGNADSSRSWVGIALIFLAALILLDNFTFLSGGVIWAGALLVVGVLLYMGHIPVGSRSGDDQEGVQQVTVDDTKPSTPASGVSPAGGGTVPPSPTPTPVSPPPAPAPPREQSILGRITIGFMILSLGILALLDNVDALAIDAEPRHYLALAVTVLGVGLLVGSVWGRARWLILLAVILVPTLLFSPVFEYNWDRDAFDARVVPTSFAELEDSYTLDVGSLVIDLTELDWNGEVIDLTVSVDAGDIEIWVPDEVGLTGNASVDVGRVASEGRESAGLGSPQLSFNEPAGDGRVDLDAHVDIGNIEIYRP